MSIVFVFLDGFGLGAGDDSNPLWRYPAPFVQQLLGTHLERGINICSRDLLCRGIDAQLGVAGMPQSATGQTALFTGINAPALMGEHQGAFPNARLREIIAEHSLLRQASEGGCRATLANAYTPLYWQLVAEGRRRHSASTLTNMAAGLPFRTFEDLERGKAVYWDITHSTFPLRYGQLLGQRPAYRRPDASGRALAGLACDHDLVLYESFLPDMVGHRRLPHTPRWTVHVLDRFLEGIVTGLRKGDTLVVSSDHGNFETMEHRMHTQNPVPLLVWGAAAPHFQDVKAITDVTPAILHALSVTLPGTKGNSSTLS